MPNGKVTCVLDGVARFARAVQLTDEHTRARTRAAIARGTKAVAAKAIARAPKRTGALAYSIRDEYAKDGMTGFVKAGYGTLSRRSRAQTARGKQRAERARARREGNALQFRLANSSKQALSVKDLGVYAPVVERGDKRRHKPARHYMAPAFQEERPTIAAELARAPIAGAHDGGLT